MTPRKTPPMMIVVRKDRKGQVSLEEGIKRAFFEQSEVETVEREATKTPF